ncbi:MAG: hypothetical protein PHI11_10530 [Gallionella sp.]|nr:hypothetical protein [Gallionella sp.]
MNRHVSKNTSLETPIGTLSFGIEADAGDVDALHISIRPVVPELPWGMSVEACVAVLLKGISLTKLEHLVFYCKWDDLKIPGQGNSGEGLEAWEWESVGKLVMIGTEDSGQLNSRLHSQQESAPERYQVTMLDNRISVRVEEFAPDKELSLHFLVAWNPSPEPCAGSCWYAVDMAHQEVMDRLNPYKVGKSKWVSFPHIAQAIGSAIGYRVGEVRDSKVTSTNYSYVEYTGRFDYQENAKRYLLCSCDGYWAVCSDVGYVFVDCAEIAAKLKAFYGINVLSKAELDAEFQLLPDLPYMPESEIEFWKPKTMGEALFNWWD